MMKQWTRRWPKEHEYDGKEENLRDKIETARAWIWTPQTSWANSSMGYYLCTNTLIYLEICLSSVPSLIVAQMNLLSSISCNISSQVKPKMLQKKLKATLLCMNRFFHSHCQTHHQIHHHRCNCTKCTISMMEKSNIHT